MRCMEVLQRVHICRQANGGTPVCSTHRVPQRSALDDIAAPTTPLDANIQHHCKKHMSHHIPVVPTNTTTDIRSRRGSYRIVRGV